MDRLSEILFIILLLIINNCNYHQVNCLINARNWVTFKCNPTDSSHLCSDILSVTHKILENDLLETVNYPKSSDLIRKSVKPNHLFTKTVNKLINRSSNNGLHRHKTKFHFPDRHFVSHLTSGNSSKFRANSVHHPSSSSSNHGSGHLEIPNSLAEDDVSGQLKASNTINNIFTRAYIVDLSGLTASSLPNRMRPESGMSPRFLGTDKRFMRRQDDSLSSTDSPENPVVKKTFGYKVTFYKSSDNKEPPIITEEFYGDGKKKKVIKILKKSDDKMNQDKVGPTKKDQLSQQSSSSSGQFIPRFSAKIVDNSKEEIDGSRKILGTLRKHLHRASEKGLEASKTLSKSGDEKQHDKKGAKEKALREKTQIEFFEREKIFGNENDRKEKKGQRERSNEQVTTKIPNFLMPSPITDETSESDFQSLHDLLLKRLKGWREKGYKITTELEVVQRGAVHDKARQVHEHGKGFQSLTQYDRGEDTDKGSSVYDADSADGQHGQPEKLFNQDRAILLPVNETNGNINSNKKKFKSVQNNNNANNGNGNSNNANSETGEEGVGDADNDDERTLNLFSSLPKFLLDSNDYENEPDSPDNGKSDQSETTTKRPTSYEPETLKFVQIVTPTASALKFPATNKTAIKSNKTRSGRKYTFKGMTREVPLRSSGTKGLSAFNSNGMFSQGGIGVSNKGLTRNHQSKSVQTTTPMSITELNVKRAKSNNKSSNLLSSSRQTSSSPRSSGYDLFTRPPPLLSPSLPPDYHQHRRPMSIQDQILFQTSPMITSGHQGHIGHKDFPKDHNLHESLSFLGEFHDGMIPMPNPNGFDEFSFGNPTLITFPDGFEIPLEHNPLFEQFKFFPDPSMNNGNSGQSGDGHRNFLKNRDQKTRFQTVAFEEPPPTRLSDESNNKGSENDYQQNSPDHQSGRGRGKVRDYPTSIQDITHGKSVSPGDTPEPEYGREMSNEQEKDDVVIGKVNGEIRIPDQHGKTNEFNSWSDELSGLNNGNTRNNGLYEAGMLKDKGQMFGRRPWAKSFDDSTNSGFRFPPMSDDQGSVVSGRTGILKSDRNRPSIVRYTTMRPPTSKIPRIESLIPISPDMLTKSALNKRERKPDFHWPSGQWTEPNPRQNQRRSSKMKNKAKNTEPSPPKPARKTKSRGESFYTTGFDSKRVRAPSNELITRSSQIYPLIGGYSPFIIPSTASDDDYDESNDEPIVEPISEDLMASDEEISSEMDKTSWDKDSETKNSTISETEPVDKSETWSAPCPDCPDV